MLIVKYEEHRNDYDRRHFEKFFKSLSDLEEWLFGLMRWEYKYHMWFNVSHEGKVGYNDPIKVHPAQGPLRYWVHQIEQDGKIIFSDGMHTNNQAFATKAVKEWFLHCENRVNKPAFNFAEDEDEVNPKQNDLEAVIKLANCKSYDNLLLLLMDIGTIAGKSDEMFRVIEGLDAVCNKGNN